tara:strand:- start:629 stop:901 length:273 start_codon:yes stop_codon:yes gene_type:complete
LYLALRIEAVWVELEEQKTNNMAFKMTSPLKHAPYAKAHTRSEGKVSHQNTAEAHGKKTQDYYDGSRGKQFNEKVINNRARKKKQITKQN